MWAGKRQYRSSYRVLTPLCQCRRVWSASVTLWTRRTRAAGQLQHSHGPFAMLVLRMPATRRMLGPFDRLSAQRCRMGVPRTASGNGQTSCMLSTHELICAMI